jgi:hypothetical protein
MQVFRVDETEVGSPGGIIHQSEATWGVYCQPVIPTDVNLRTSSCIGNLSWDPDVRALCREADLLVAIGTRFQGPNTENWTMELRARGPETLPGGGGPRRDRPDEVNYTGTSKPPKAS